MMKLKPILRKWLPSTGSGITIAVFGYLVLVSGLLGTPYYFLSHTYFCGENSRPITALALGLGLTQIVLAIVTLFVIRGLTKFTHRWYKSVALAILVIIFAVQTYLITGYTFFGTEGAMCS